MNDDSFWISDPAKIVKVDRFGIDLKFMHDFVMQRWSRPRSYAALWEPHKREGGKGWRMRGREKLFQGAPSIHEYPTLLQGFSIYRRMG
jgi:hypothetical protein